MSCVFISVLTDNIFYLISFESSAFRRGSNLFPSVYRIAEVKGFKSIPKLLSKKQKKLVNTNFRMYLFLRRIVFREYLSLRMASFEFTNFSSKEKRIRKKQLNQVEFRPMFLSR